MCIRDRIVASRIVSVDVKLVFVGIGESDVDLQYMSWSENLPKTVNTQVIIGGKDIGVTSNIKYQYSFASSNFKEKLISYLSSIAESKPSRTPVIQSNQLSSFASLCMALTEEPDKCFR